MKVELIDFTGKGRIDEMVYAARLLAFTKNTRLSMTPDGFEAWQAKPWLEIEKELAYMASTIPSSWEFVNCTFTIQGLTRAGFQQLSRTRFTPMDSDVFGAYAQQSQRVTDMSEVEISVPTSLDPDQRAIFSAAIDYIKSDYAELVASGAPLEDARGILPMNSQCNAVVAYNLRNLAELFRKRQSLRVQGEYQEIVRQMRAQVEAAWPWSKVFFVPKDHKAIEIIEEVAKTLPPEQRARLAKAADLIKL